ncbi:hypothetical protein [Niveispirillum cyanobacteriorum]|uniref:Uncharacterized protein n=1 Tax=Niveispirillum cyanobacteriorum TaxID=1612173 RepID=A0A2K9N929_9PROT|nr:hypothetical protein [Niveispirillum cyanobacteriorum]AUN29056.1 hypothetical protein C0V82_01415 [Niveispirillum cyanobacteriorum]GGE67982.1 hypothetical protein GCM10011317_26530 [Niveispirillum cyanobacteriorum]
MLLAVSDAILALACLWAGWSLLTEQATGPVRLLAAAILALAIPSSLGALHFAGWEPEWLTILHQDASEIYALLGFVSIAVALFLLPGTRRASWVVGLAVLLVGGLILAGQKPLVGSLSSLFILAGTLRLLLRSTGAARLWLGLSILGVVLAALTRIPGLMGPDARIIGLHLGLALWVATQAMGVRGYSSSADRMGPMSSTV